MMMVAAAKPTAAGEAIASSTATPLPPETGEGYRLLDVKTARFEL